MWSWGDYTRLPNVSQLGALSIKVCKVSFARVYLCLYGGLF